MMAPPLIAPSTITGGGPPDWFTYALFYACSFLGGLAIGWMARGSRPPGRRPPRGKDPEPRDPAPEGPGGVQIPNVIPDWMLAEIGLEDDLVLSGANAR